MTGLAVLADESPCKDQVLGPLRAYALPGCLADRALGCNMLVTVSFDILGISGVGVDINVPIVVLRNKFDPKLDIDLASLAIFHDSNADQLSSLTARNQGTVNLDLAAVDFVNVSVNVMPTATLLNDALISSSVNIEAVPGNNIEVGLGANALDVAIASSAPTLIDSNPGAGAVGFDLSEITLQFSAELDTSLIDLAGITLTNLGDSSSVSLRAGSRRS